MPSIAKASPSREAFSVASQQAGESLVVASGFWVTARYPDSSTGLFCNGLSGSALQALADDHSFHDVAVPPRMINVGIEIFYNFRRLIPSSRLHILSLDRATWNMFLDPRRAWRRMMSSRLTKPALRTMSCKTMKVEARPWPLRQ